LLIKYIKSVLWRVSKCLSYIEEARCLKVKAIRVGNTCYLSFLLFQFEIFNSTLSSHIKTYQDSTQMWVSRMFAGWSLNV